MGAVREVLLTRNYHLALGVAALVVVVIAGNLIVGRFTVSFSGQPVAHSAHVWNFLGMVLAGLAYAMGGGCPGRQLFLSGEGDGDAGVFVLGMVTGAAFCHNLALAGVPDKVVAGATTVGGPGPNGQIAVVLGLVFCVVLGLFARERAEA